MAVPQTSVYTGILAAVKAKVVALALSSDVTVLTRKHPVIGVDDTLPLVLISPEKELVVGQDTRGILILDYPVLVTIAIAGNQLLETNVAQLLDWREAIRFELNAVTLTDVPSVMDCNLELNPPFEFPRYKGELDASAIRFTYRSSESWNR